MYAVIRDTSYAADKPTYETSGCNRKGRSNSFFAFLIGVVISTTPIATFAQAVTRGEMMTRTNEATDEAEIRSLIDNWVQAFRIRSVDAAMALHAPGIVSFDIVPPLRYVGNDYRKAWEAAFALFEGPIDLELRDLSITVRDDIAFSYSLNRFMGTMKNGQKSDYWFRWTACFQKIKGKWLIVHDHTSLPTDFASGKAMQDLKP